MKHRWLLLAALAVSLLSPLATANAAGTVVVSGRVYNSDTGQGYGNVAISLCGAGSATTTANGNWQVTLASGTSYCARVGAGVPAGLAGPVTRNNPEVGTVNSYENQLAGVNCYKNSGCDPAVQSWDRVIDGGLDFIYAGSPATPTPSPTVSPAAFAATADPKQNDIVLTWPAAADGSSYHLDRSMDQTTWEPVADKLTDTTYSDTTVLPGVHYYYRLQTIAADGTASDYVLADTTTHSAPSVEGASTEADTSLVSSDHTATASLIPGTVPDNSSCKIITSPGINLNGGGRSVIAGAYQLSCEASDGTDVTDFKHPVKWQINLTGKTSGYTDPQGAHYASGSDQPRLERGSYDSHSHILSVQLPGADQVAVLASVQDDTWLNYVVIGGAILAILVVLAFMPIRLNRKRTYQDYLRSKYYNL